MPATLPPASALPSLPTQTQEAALSLLFEPSPPLLSLLQPHLSPAAQSWPELINRLRDFLLKHNASVSKGSAEEKVLIEVLGSHPRLGEKKVHSEISRMEQAAMAKASAATPQGDSEEVQEKLRVLNKEYEEKFPGLRYVVFVNARPRSVIMENMRQRIDRGDYEAEKVEGINAMCDIAIDRASKLDIVDSAKGEKSSL
ncbi:hypothetical protein BJ508DRAFT_373361 [Ascobolus immersus RN42]|uniref:Oxo-4-hydroxy-4-carboxy-5-ureidoimidazoline decarboxylase domain-containing protein n=1 Tax=Ascobolus immersus RN42 TaxID=1160509 RepID=A0A3N4II03_ASCIM|nr:hypothetical protein BJ508DRAFT_373361 [Ascobolus immersus RN42]